ncbi:MULTISPECIES: 4-hydroxy-tetrahydrodipicolinate synthase [unclassified Paenibacillus]|uniref:4-hydroxy-tetrahydrodipicolinate synthase n=1 Tax=unclassified Paenibacillus TaxID=185978 RepID=UPI002405C917|nr:MULTISPECIES: 4-hydroxy-tetrahydrodipicolinate synthase [unclassified Paenibacillus]MDF9841300.1 4-hydroxy-tetrahydrodipicolinate synthase [Paenibacillus sp. PastF-2]MDF9847891.1 4-hydroxy-tetrahydrodipicolinate synthase [Paenibacillus sp. PastM-2]MDF9854459.1 4-hydroxy-tetrahydrodipicolinate synthase [Paenibacillus sp. PastF-1]MDH6479932.1 4-hydroxy-tetrahydrodipicolinate synthase [Paenibacillus sp. PastH-2]MDH6507166.1 4-hydroxy-tetrahydrodipicolinate synthase [Paenibacillus sp. PastM-3]
MLTEEQIYGIYVPVVTPFDAAGEIDLASYQRYVQGIIKNNIHGLVVNGTTGESPTVSIQELQLLIDASKQLLQGSDIPLVIGTGTNDTMSTVKRTELAANAGVDAALVVVPYYSRPSQQGIIAHFRKAAEVGIPIIAYDIPGRAGVGMTVDTARTILEMDNVVGLKDCSGSPLLVSELSRHGSKPVLCGDDLSFFDMLGYGAAGGMLASANVHTARFLDIYEQYRAGQVEAARAEYDRLVPLMKLLFKESNPAPIKWLLSAKGEISSDTLRLPMTSISDALREELGAHLAG